MAIVHLHIEKTGGVTLQKLYGDKYGDENVALFNVRDGLFAPFSIHTANYTKNWQLHIYKLLAAKAPRVRRHLIRKRGLKRKEQEVRKDDLPNAKVVIGHFSLNDVIDSLNPGTNQYRTLVREPLERTWSHYKYWKEHKGDLGQRYVPNYHQSISFEDFAMLPEMQNYQSNAIGNSPELFDYIGTTNNLKKFALDTGLIHRRSKVPILNKLNSKPLPKLSDEFITQFKMLNNLDYELYQSASKIS